MKCPRLACVGDTMVVKTRTHDDGVRRQRECLSCSWRFTTVEQIVDIPDGIRVIRSEGTEPFSAIRLKESLQRLGSSHTFSAATVVRDVSIDLVDAGTTEISPRELVEAVTRALVVHGGELLALQYWTWQCHAEAHVDVSTTIREFRRVTKRPASIKASVPA